MFAVYVYDDVMLDGVALVTVTDRRGGDALEREDGVGRSLGVDGESLAESAREHQRRAADRKHPQVQGPRVSHRRPHVRRLLTLLCARIGHLSAVRV